MPAEYVIVADRLDLDDVRFVSGMYHEQKIMIAEQYTPIEQYIKSIWNELFGERFFNYRNKHIGIFNGKFYFAGSEFHFTKTEQRIVNLMLYTGNSFSVDMIAAYCLPNSICDPERSVRVHISNINAKTEYMCDQKLIVGKRMKGYRVNADLEE